MFKPNEQFLHDVMEGMTYYFMTDLLSSDGALVKLEDNKVSEQEIYERVKEKIKIGLTEKLLLLYKQGDILKDVPEDEALELLYEPQQEQIAKWEYVEANWSQVVKDHKAFLKPYGVSFELVEGEESSKLPEDQNQNQREYEVNQLTFDVKKSSPMVVKLLFTTLAKRHFTKAVNEELSLPQMELNGSLLPKLSKRNTFYKVLSQLADTTGLSRMETKLKEIAKTIPDVYSLYYRLFHKKSEARNKDEWRILHMFYGSMGKQTPTYWVMKREGDETYLFDANYNTQAQRLIEEWFSNLRLSPLVKTEKDGSYVLSISNLPKPQAQDKKSQLDFLKGIHFPVTKEEIEKIPHTQASRFNQALSSLYSLLQKSEIHATNKSIGAESHVKVIAQTIARAQAEDVSATHTGIDGEQFQQYLLPSSVSFMLNRINEANSLEELYQIAPHLKDIFSQNSKLLENFYKTENKQKLTLGVIEGFQTEDNASSTSKQSLALRRLQEFNANLQGIYYLLVPADAKTEWTIKNNFFVSLPEYQVEALYSSIELFKNYLKAEVELINDYDNRSHIEEIKKNGKHLRFFKNILSPSLVEQIEQSTNLDFETLFSSIQEQFTTDLQTFLYNISKETFNHFAESGIISQTAENKFIFEGLNSHYLKSIGKTPTTPLTEKEVMDAIGFRTLNYIINNIELYKVFYGDPAQFKDANKRIKSSLSGRIQTAIGDDGYNDWALIEQNKAQDIQLKPGDPGYLVYSTSFNSLTFDHGDSPATTVVSRNIELYKEVLGEKASAYESINGIDAQSYRIDVSTREFLNKSQGSWTDEMEQMHQILMAATRYKLSQKKLYTYTDQNLRKQDEKLKDNPRTGSLFVSKLIGFGPIENNLNLFISNLIKTSELTLYYPLIEGNPQLEELYLFMWKNNIHHIGPKSQHKVGTPSNTPPLYNKETGELQLSSLTPEQITPYKMPWEFYGIQVETSNKNEQQTRGSQMTKLATDGLYDNGVPVKREYETLLNNHEQVLSELTEVYYTELLNKLGISETSEGYTLSDANKLISLLKDEVARREMPKDLLNALDTTYNPDTDTYELKTPLEALPNYQLLKNIIWAAADKAISRPKMNGAPKVQVSGELWEKNKRQAMYKPDGTSTWTMVEDYQALSETEKATVRLTSSDLKFYSRDTKTGTTTHAEVLLPNHFAEKLRRAGIKKTDQELLEYLNKSPEGKKLLSGIGFRIPTQGLNSMEVFTIKGFLPKEYGDVVVVPSEITAKAGSDFDMDKLNLYLRNFYIFNGEILPIPYYGFGQEAIDKFETLVLPLLLNKKVKADEDALENLDFTEEDESTSMDALKLYKQSLENQYYDTLEEILTLPENFARLITPNSSDEMKAEADNLETLKGITKEGKSINYSNQLNPLWMSEKRQLLLSNKDNVGKAATAQTAHSLFQKASIIAQPSPEVLSNEERQVFSRYRNSNGEPIYDFSLKLNHGGEEINLSKLTDAEGKYISDKVSQYINGSVDAANDDYLSRFGVNESSMDVYIFLERAGVPMHTVGLFLQQPAIIEYLNTKEKENTLRAINPDRPFTSDEKIYTQVKSKFPSKAVSWKENTFTNEELSSSISKYASKQPFSEAENTLQIQALDEFLKYKVYADHLFQFTQSLSWDTTRFNSNHVAYIKERQHEHVKRGNLFGNPDSLLNTSFIGTIKNKTLQFKEAYQAISALQTPNAQQALQPIYKTFSNPELKMSSDDREKIMQRAEMSLLDYLIQTQVQIDGATLNKYLSPILLNPNTNVASKLSAAKQSLSDNLALNGLIAFVRPSTHSPKNVKLMDKPSGAQESDMFTEALRELKNNAETQSLYQNLVILGLLQSGVRMSPISFNKYIPQEDWVKYLQPAINSIASADLSYFSSSFYRNNWQNSTIVPLHKKDPELSETLQTSILRIPTTHKNAKYDVVKVQKLANIPKEQIQKMKAKGDYSYIITRLFQKVKENDNGVIVPGEKTDFLLYKEIFPQGDGQYAQEHHSAPRPSIFLKNYQTAREVSDAHILSQLYHTTPIKETEVLSPEQKLLALKQQGVIKTECK